MKSITLSGTVGKDAIVQRTQNGEPVLNFSLAVDDGYGANKKTMWFDVSMFGKRGQALQPHVKKGSRLTAVGDFGIREREGKTYFQCRASDIDLQWSPKPQEERAANSNRIDPDEFASRQGAAAGGGMLDDDIPFAPEFR